MKKIIIVLALVAMFPVSAFATSDLGTLQETIAIGKSLSVGLNPSVSGSWYVTANSNSDIASAAASTSSLLIKGLAAGSTAISVCTDTAGTHCLAVNVTVTGGSVLGASITLPHLPGSWIISDGTVFYVTSAGIIPISTWKIFLSNGGKAANIQPAYDTDLSLNRLPIMKAADSRVR